jgi:protein phosphatase
VNILTAAGLTDQGQHRKQNEDHVFVDSERGIFIVSDGMGGRVAGELASKIVVEVLPGFLLERLQQHQAIDTAAAKQIVVQALCELSEMIQSESSKRPDLFGLGATIVMALIRHSYMLLAHVGDSRAYLFRDNSLSLLTKDHSIIQLLIDMGQLKPEDASTHPARSQITQFIGMEGKITPDVQSIELQAGDRLLLCSDGLTGMVADADIEKILKQPASPEGTCQFLIDAANDAGGKDNISVILVNWYGETE